MAIVRLRRGCIVTADWLIAEETLEASCLPRQVHSMVDCDWFCSAPSLSTANQSNYRLLTSVSVKPQFDSVQSFTDLFQ